MNTVSLVEVDLESSADVLALLRQLREQVKLVRAAVQKAHDRIREDTSDVPLNEGISLLRAKLRLLVAYTRHLARFATLRAQGQDASHLVIDLVKLRFMLRRLRPVERTLRSQVDTLVALAQRDVTAQVDTKVDADALTARPNFSLSDSEEEEGNDEQGEADAELAGMRMSDGSAVETDARGLYVAPKRRYFLQQRHFRVVVCDALTHTAPRRCWIERRGDRKSSRNFVDKKSSSRDLSWSVRCETRWETNPKCTRRPVYTLRARPSRTTSTLMRETASRRT
ncbi:MAG: hypothetical protein MHM6MM_003229 [Cercozoa sp. M6MM]